MPRASPVSADRTVQDLVRVASRFLRSTHLERDFRDPDALVGYVATPSVLEAIQRVMSGMVENSGRRAWRITGDYGVGKSSFALVLAQLLAGLPVAGAELKSVLESVCPKRTPEHVPILITGSRERLTVSLANGISDAVDAGVIACEATSARLKGLAVKAALSGSHRDVENVVECLRSYASAREMGVCLIIDELGKALEHAASSPDADDLMLLQRLAELATRSGARPFVFIVLLHQGFVSYAHRLPSTRKNEWEKVAGRFEELVFDQPLTHTAMLVSAALNLDHTSLCKAVSNEESRVWDGLAKNGWLGKSPVNETASTYPVHPTALPVLARFFARYGQNERSLFSFLLSNEPNGLQSTLGRQADDRGWYRLSDFYDYVRSNYGFRLAGESHRSAWSRISAIIDSAVWAGEEDLWILKSVAILNLLDADDLRPLDSVLAISLAIPKIQLRIADLVSRGALFRRGRDGGLRLWSGASIDLSSALEVARMNDQEPRSTAHAVCRFMETQQVAARRHYISTGTLRFFNLSYTTGEEIHSLAARQLDGDGSVIVIVTESQSQIEAARREATELTSGRDDLLVVVAPRLEILASDLQDERLWRWILSNTPELGQDPYALAEVERQLRIATDELLNRLHIFLPANGKLPKDAIVVWQGSVQPWAFPSLGMIVSYVCDQRYALAPLIRNELLNRTKLSSAAAAARMRLIEAMFESGRVANLGLDPEKSPPERAIYMSVLAKGGVHRNSQGRFEICEPDPTNDPLRMRPALDMLLARLSSGQRVSAADLLKELSVPPFGVREGFSPLLLAIFICVHAHEVAIYERGTFLSAFGGPEFLRLLKAPKLFEAQLCSIKGVRSQVFHRLQEVLGGDAIQDGECRILDVVKPLCQFAAALPECTRLGKSLSASALLVRDALLASREPGELVFKTLPEACGVEKFDEYACASPSPSPSPSHVDSYVDRLKACLQELQTHYERLVADIRLDLVKATGTEDIASYRGSIALRATGLLEQTLEPRIRAFALRLADRVPSDDRWVEAISTVIAQKPPTRWLESDYHRWRQEVGFMGTLFQRLEALNFDAGDGAVKAVRVGLTRSDGMELVRIVRECEKESETGLLLGALRLSLKGSKQAKLNALAVLLWQEFESDE